MKIFEFHFNPESDQTRIFDSFCYEPQSQREKKLGSLYIVGELKNAIPQDAKLLSSIAPLLKKEFFVGSFPETALRIALKKGNDFLFDRTKMGSTNWLGNLSVATLCFKDNELYFSKDGKIKVLLLRPGQITDIGKTLEGEDFEPYPLKIFTNIVSGRFFDGDKIIVLTEEIFNYFFKTGFLEKISLLAEPKQIKDIFAAKENNFASLSGICFLMLLAKEALPKSELTFRKISRFSLKEILSPVLERLSPQKLKGLFSKIVFKKPVFKIKRKPKTNPKTKISPFKLKKFSLALPKIKIDLSSFSLPKIKSKKNHLLVLVLIAFLILGFFVSQIDRNVKTRVSRDQLLTIQEEIVRAKGYLAVEQEDKADAILKDAFIAILPLTRPNSPVQKDALLLKAVLEKELLPLNKFQEAKLKTIFDFENKKIVPQRLVSFQNNLYFFSPYEKKMAKLSFPGFSNMETIEATNPLSAAAETVDSLVFYSAPNKIIPFKDNSFGQEINLELSGANASFIDITSLRDNLYLLEKDSAKVFRWFFSDDQNNREPSLWTNPGEKKAMGAKSIAVGDRVFVLSLDNSILEYRAGKLENTIIPSIFPFPKKFSRVILSPLFTQLIILEPSQERVIVIDRAGKLISQFQSKEFISLKDAVFSADNKSLYLLSGLKVFRLDLTK